MAEPGDGVDFAAPIVVGLAAGTAFTGFGIAFWTPAPALPEALNYLLQGLGGAAGGWWGHRCRGFFE